MGFMIRILVLLLFLVQSMGMLANYPKKQLTALRTHEKIKIDGLLDEPDWSLAEAATSFVTYSPTMGYDAFQPTEVRVLYNNNAIYIGAYLFDRSADSIMTEYTRRDGLQSANTDKFKISLNPYNDGQNIFEFEVSTANVQADCKQSASSSSNSWMRGDYTWDAVWTSAVTITDDGWIVEVEIPFAAIRFPSIDVQRWGVNFWRDIRRTRETSVWNPVDRSFAEESQIGELLGIHSIKAPLRLELYPFAAAYYQVSPEGKGSSWAAGMDLKYGINEAYTLDMTLIPDFGQRKSDQVVLNLTPYEVKYEENRQFFTEGVELFNKSGLLYSRRIGKRPDGYYDVYGQLGEGETILFNPEETKLINATKVSGRNSSKLGVGFFNAMTANTYATIMDQEGQTREVMTNPFMNYNMLVVDQIIGKHSFVNLTNTNVLTPSTGRTANVSGLSFRVRDRMNRYGVSGLFSGSLKNDNSGSGSDTGFQAQLGFGKYAGSFTANYSASVVSDTFDPNDMGYLRMNNFINHDLMLSHRILVPFWVFNSVTNSLSFGYDWLYNPQKYMRFGVNYQLRFLFRNYWDLNFSVNSDPVKQHDWYEPRVSGWFYERPAYVRFTAGGSTDYRKAMALQFGYERRITTNDENSREVTLNPRFRFSDRFSMFPKVQLERVQHEKGFASKLSEDSILFGRRDVDRVTTTLSGSYVFNNRSALSLSLRHYWSFVDYDQYFLLLRDGTLDSFEAYSGNKDINFNILSVDFEYSWNFAPGSYLTAVWKNNIYTSEDIPDNLFPGYWDNLNGTIQSPQINSFSLKVTYYFDYHRIVRKGMP